MSILDGSIDDLNVVTLNLTSDAAVQTLPGLRSLLLQSYATNRVDITAFPKLEKLWTYWRSGSETALEATRLRALTIAKYPFASVEPLARLIALEHLGLRNSRRLESLTGIDHMHRLVKLELIDDRRLSDIEALATADCRLTHLRIQDCRRLAHIDPIAHQRDLAELHLSDCGDVHSIRPLSGLPRLERLWLDGTTNIVDGDVSVLVGLPSLQETAFAPRRHYSMRPEEIERAIAARRSKDER